MYKLPLRLFIIPISVVSPLQKPVANPADTLDLTILTSGGLTIVIIISLLGILRANATPVHKVFALLILSIFTTFLWIIETQFLFIYLVYILAFVGAVLILFLSVVLMLPISTITIHSFPLLLLLVTQSSNKPDVSWRYEPSWTLLWTCLQDPWFWPFAITWVIFCAHFTGLLYDNLIYRLRLVRAGKLTEALSSIPLTPTKSLTWSKLLCQWFYREVYFNIRLPGSRYHTLGRLVFSNRRLLPEYDNSEVIDWLGRDIGQLPIPLCTDFVLNKLRCKVNAICGCNLLQLTVITKTVRDNARQYPKINFILKSVAVIYALGKNIRRFKEIIINRLRSIVLSTNAWIVSISLFIWVELWTLMWIPIVVLIAVTPVASGFSALKIPTLNVHVTTGLADVKDLLYAYGPEFLIISTIVLLVALIGAGIITRRKR